jgi:phospholipid N-methyltransferase
VSVSASYDPGDNKIRIRSTSRFAKEDFERLKKAGFKWAPRQELFVAPMWTPEREDLAVEMAGELEDEDTSLVDRAEERAERFGEYSEHRADDAEAAHRHVESITNGIPLGQTILVGHHSERHARKDAERIENGMRKAVRMWETAKYWERRAAGALRHAKYKELPAVRMRRIKTLEADVRRQERTKDKAQKFLTMWTRTDVELTLERAVGIANYDWVSVQEEGKSYTSTLWSMLTDGKMSVEAAREKAKSVHERAIALCDRWLAHLGNRLAYERAMLGEVPQAVSKPKKLEERPALDALKGTLKAGVKVVAAPQLFPTPPELAERMAKIVQDSTGRVRNKQSVLEPSAGTGNLVRACLTLGMNVTAVEINGALHSELSRLFGSLMSIYGADFLSLTPEDVTEAPFDAVVMNPPFADGQDIRHIEHARKFIRPGGVVIALCANGPRQEKALRPFARSWEELPEGTFSEQGTNVRVVLATFGAVS